MQARLLAIALGVVSLAPLGGLAIGFGWGAAYFLDGPVPPDLDNQLRYLSGVYVAVSLTVWWTLLDLRARVMPLRIVGCAVALGALGRCVSMAQHGLPSDPSLIAGLLVEGVGVPLLLVWHARVASTSAGGG